MKQTEEQERIYTFVLKRHENLMINAYAGCGKTYTAINCAKLLPKDKSILFLAFNKHIQEELKIKLPEYIKCYTTYGIGMAAIKRKYGDNIKFDEFKVDKSIQKKAKTWNLEEEFKNEEEISLYLNSIKKLVNLCRLTLTLKEEYIPYLCDRYEVNLSKSIDIKRVLKVLDDITTNRDVFDYTDMIYLPAIDNSIWMFQYDYVFLDEFQDVNRCQIKILEKVIKRERKTGKILGRFFVFGDRKQQIYGFNGSDDKVTEWFEKFPNTKQLNLSTSFRCSKNVIIEAQKIVPDIKALNDAPDGIVRDGDVINEVKDGDFILCRTTMPLIKLFFQLLLKNKKVMIKGSDIGVHLIELIGKINTIDTLIKFWNDELSQYKKDLYSQGILNPNEHSGYAALEDKVNVLLFLAKISDNIQDLTNKIKVIFSDEIKGIVLSTVHKIKGLEADRVFIVRPDLLPMPNIKGWQYAQEKNLEYVAITRSKLELIYDRTWTDE